jgi:hypothetical protein
MLGDTKSTLPCRKSRLAWSWHFPFTAMFMCTTSIAFFCVLSAIPTTAAATAGISVHVDPLTGDDSRCNTTFICRTIAHAVQLVGASHVNLSAGVFNESTVSIDNVSSLVVSGVPDKFNIYTRTCVRAHYAGIRARVMNSTGAAIYIYSSSFFLKN